jgi:hypothetical protein
MRNGAELKRCVREKKSSGSVIVVVEAYSSLILVVAPVNTTVPCVEPRHGDRDLSISYTDFKTVFYTISRCIDNPNVKYLVRKVVLYTNPIVPYLYLR